MSAYKNFGLTIFAFFLLNSIQSQTYLSVDELNFNRSARTLNPLDYLKLPHAHTGFKWESGDNKTPHWRPQGICGMKKGRKNFMIVSWYAMDKDNYAKRGVRISVVDVTNMNRVKYRHILLRDKNGDTFENMHAGGLVFRRGKLHVPDTRKGQGHKIHVFDMNKIIQVNSKNNYGYRYTLKSESHYNSPVKPSFLSYDWDNDKILVGRFTSCSDRSCSEIDCRRSSSGQLSWFDINNSDSESFECSHFLCDMQGAASKNKGSKKQTIWISSSYGRNNKSRLFILERKKFQCDARGGHISKHKVFKYPPGLEDLHLSSTSDNLWLLTEFGPHEANNERIVFAIKTNRITH